LQYDNQDEAVGRDEEGKGWGIEEREREER